MERHRTEGSPRSVTNISSRCQVDPGLRRTALARCAKLAPNLSHQRPVAFSAGCQGPAHSLGPVRKAGAELVAPATDRLVAEDHAALEHQLFDVTQAQLKPEVPAHRLADHHPRDPMAVIRRLRLCHPATLQHRQRDNASPTSLSRTGGQTNTWTGLCRKPKT